jgi:hypothetical protein
MASVFRWKESGPWLIQFFDQHGRHREKSSRPTGRLLTVSALTYVQTGGYAIECEFVRLGAMEVALVESGLRIP